jgi:hypothetical protein
MFAPSRKGAIWPSVMWWVACDPTHIDEIQKRHTFAAGPAPFPAAPTPAFAITLKTSFGLFLWILNAFSTSNMNALEIENISKTFECIPRSPMTIVNRFSIGFWFHIRQIIHINSKSF